MQNNEAIIRKVQGLLAIAKDNAVETEAQSAFLLAQKLMIKHNLELSDVEFCETEKINKNQVTAHKRIYWWESELAQIISENFRVKHYYNNDHKSAKHVKRAIVFLGFESDVELAKEMYILAYECIEHYTKRFIELYYKENELNRERAFTQRLKDSYMNGFLDGMNKRFEEQVSEMRQEYRLVLLVPQEVKDVYSEMFDGKRGLNFKVPNVEEAFAYGHGYSEGQRVDFTKSTIEEP